jgi:hypothetical protein
MFSYVSLLGTSSADLASVSDDVFKPADKDDPIAQNGGRERPLWHGKSDCAVQVFQVNDSCSTHV